MKLKHTLAAIGMLAFGASSAAAATLDDVKANGVLKCGISTGLPGFAFTDESGNWQGFDVAYCQALAAAILGDASKIEYTLTTTKNRFTTLSSGEVDILSRNTTWTFSRDVDLKFTFLGVNYYDGQGFIVPRSLGVSSVKDLDGASICVQVGTTTELNLAEYFRINGISYEPVPVETNEEARTNYLAGRCDSYTTDVSGLAASRSSFDNPADHVILPEIVSKEPLGPLVRHGDDQWADIGRWVLNVLIIADEKGLTGAEAAKMMESADKEINRILGIDGEYGAMLGLDKNWAARALAAGGNYGEIFDQYLGEKTDVNLARGLNAQWNKGGILYAPPFR